MEGQATKLRQLRRRREAIELFERIPVRQLSPMTFAYVEAKRGNALAWAGPQYHSACLRALDRAATASQDADAEDPPPWLAYFSATKPLAHRVELRRAYSYIPPGLAEDAYRMLEAAQRRQPASMYRGTGSVHKAMARAAVGMGDLERAYDHIVQAHEIFATTSPRRLEQLRELVAGLSANYDSAAVRELHERVHADYQPPRNQPDGGEATQPRRKVGGARYVQVRSAHVDDGRWMLHKEDCLSALRAKRSYPWPKGNRRTPQHLANDPAVRAKNVPCAVCIGRLWA